MPARSAFTLIELLVVIVIIGILAAMAMAVMFQAQEAARRSRTEGIVGMLSNQMAFRWDSYRTRRLPITTVPGGTGAYDIAIAAMGTQPNVQQVASLQLIARRQLMRMELPDRWFDVAYDDGGSNWVPAVPSGLQISSVASKVPASAAYDGSEGPVTGALVTRSGVVGSLPWSNVERVVPDLIQRTSLSLAYQRRYQQVIQQSSGNAAPTSQYQQAECLYMILTTGMGDESTGGGTFNQRDFADVDEDGMPEFIDGWGRPIHFLRWAPGFRSDMQSGDPVNDHDPFDPRRADPIAFRLFPLIVSSGPDGAINDGVNSPTGMEFHNEPGNSDNDDSTTNDDFDNVNLNDPYAPRHLKPTVKYMDGTPVAPSGYIFRGERFREEAGVGSSDNIFNQALQIR